MSQFYQTRFPGLPRRVSNRSLVTSIESGDMAKLAGFLASGRNLATPHWWHDPGLVTGSTIDDPYYKFGAVWLPAGTVAVAVTALYGGAEWTIEWSTDGSTWDTLTTVMPEVGNTGDKWECGLVQTAPYTGVGAQIDGAYHYPIPATSAPQLIHWRATLSVGTVPLVADTYLETSLWAVCMDPVFQEQVTIS